jgi:hypothetical protein
MALLITLSSGCFKPATPKGFEAVVPADETPIRRGCPNLVDTYVLDSAQEQNKILGKVSDQKDFSYFVIDALIADQAYNYSLRVDQSYFIHYAQQLKIADAEKYYYWRENTLALRKKYSEDNRLNVLKYGAAFEQREQMHVYGCADGWVKIQQIETSTQDIRTGEPYVKQDDVWLARDMYGDLLIHTISYQEKPGWTFWAAGGAGARLIRLSDTWGKLRKAPDANLSTPWIESDLPLAARPIQNINECRLPDHQILDLNQRLLQSGMIVEKFELQPSAIKEGTCVQPSLILGFVSNGSAQSEEIMKMLLKDSFADHIEILETRLDIQGKSHYLLQVSLQLPKNMH